MMNDAFIADINLTWSWNMILSMYYWILGLLAFCLEYLHIKLIYFHWRIINSILMVFAIHWHESATGIHVCPLSWTPLPPPSPPNASGLSQTTSFGNPLHASNLHWHHFTYGNVHVSMLFSQIIPPLPSSNESKSVLYIHVSFAALHVGSLLPSF